MTVRWPAHAAREAVLADLERAVAAAPAALDARFYQASFLRDHGRLDDAIAVFEHILERAPDHVETLVAYGVAVARRGRRLDARAAFARAVAADATHYGALVNLAGAFALDEPDRAAKLFEAAIARDPTREAAHRGMCSLAAARGDRAAAAHHRRAGYASGSMTMHPYFGAHTPLRALALVSTDGGNIPIDALLDPHAWLVHELAVEAYRDEPLPPHTVLVNAIADADRGTEALRRANEIVDAIDRPAVNDPAAVARTRRAQQTAVFADLADVVVPATWPVREHRTPPVLPVIVRVPGLHMGRGAWLATDADSYAGALAAYPNRDDLIASAYVETRSADGVWRKYRVMYVGGVRYPVHLAIGERWSVHYFSSANAEQAAYRDEEARFLADPAHTIGAAAWAAVGAIGERLGLDYAGLDFGLDARGRVVVFEANAAMTVIAPDPDPRFAYRIPAYDRVRAAVARMIERAAASERG